MSDWRSKYQGYEITITPIIDWESSLIDPAKPRPTIGQRIRIRLDGRPLGDEIEVYGYSYEQALEDAENRIDAIIDSL